MATSISKDPTSGDTNIAIRIEREFDVDNAHSLLNKHLNEAAKVIAEEWVQKYYQNIVASIDMNAVVNMVLLEVAKETKARLLDE